MDEVLEQVLGMQRLTPADTIHTKVTTLPQKNENLYKNQTSVTKAVKGVLAVLEATGKLPKGRGEAHSLIKSWDGMNSANAKVLPGAGDKADSDILIAFVKNLKAVTDYLKATGRLNGFEWVEGEIKKQDAALTIYDNALKIISNTKKSLRDAIFSDVKAAIKIVRGLGAIMEASGEIPASLDVLYRAVKIFDGVGTAGDGILGMLGNGTMADGAGAVVTELGAGTAIAGGAEAGAVAVGFSGLGLIGLFTYAAATGQIKKETEAEAKKRVQLKLKSPIAFWEAGMPVTVADIDYVNNAKRKGDTSFPRYQKVTTLMDMHRQPEMMNNARQVTQPFISPMRFNGRILSLFPTAIQNRQSKLGKEITAGTAVSHRSQPLSSSISPSININTPLIGSLNISTKNMTEGYDKVKQEILQVLLEVFNRAAPAH